jgi:hypothetical protein
LLHHEVGHFIDHIVNDNGITVEESNRRIDETQDNYEKYYKWLEKYEKEPGYSPDTVSRAYYNIPSEARANEYGGIDVEEMIKIKNEHYSKIGSKAVTVSVDIVKIEDKPDKE